MVASQSDDSGSQSVREERGRVVSDLTRQGCPTVRPNHDAGEDTHVLVIRYFYKPPSPFNLTIAPF